MFEFIIDNIPINIIRRRVKYLRVGIYPRDNQVRVVSPLKLKDEEIKKFVISKISWIKKHLEKLALAQEAQKNNPDLLSDKACREKLNKLIPGLITKWQDIMGVDVAEWRIKKMKTRWGTCNTRARRIWTNLNLGNKSLNCLEYIIVHEMVHILEASHNKRFKAFMDKFMPEWKAYRNELKSNN